MSDNKLSLAPDVVESLSKAVPQSVKETDGAISTVVGFFNNVVLYPVKKANITFRYKLESFEEDLKEKTKRIPEENLQIPSTMIAGPTLEALRYSYDEQALREMFENLLASAMDNRIADEVHPAFVDAIKQMSPLDAIVFKKIVDLGRLKCADIVFQLKGMTKVYTKAMPNHFVVELSELNNPFLISTSLTNLERLALIKIVEGSMMGEDYSIIREHPYVQRRKEMFKTLGKEFDIEVHERAVIITNFGEQFARTCLAKEI